MTTLVLSRYLPPRLVARIDEACPWVEVVSAPNAMLDTEGRIGLLYRSDERWTAESPIAHDVTDVWEELLLRADVLFDLHPAAIDLLATAAPRLTFIQALAAGAGELLSDQRIARAEIPVCTARGVHDGPLADFAFAAILAYAKRLDEFADLKQRRSWTEIEAVRLDGTTMIVVGLGSIGAAVARRARAFDITVRGVHRTPRPTDLVDSVHSLDELDELLPQADWVVVALPGGAETTHVFDVARFERCKSGAFFVNVGRGSTVDEDALMGALGSHRLGGAALDVVAHEPLARESPLWDISGLTLSAHCASLAPGTIDRIVDILIDNLTRLHNGRALINVATPDGHQAADADVGGPFTHPNTAIEDDRS